MRLKVVEAAIRANQAQLEVILKKLIKLIGNNLSGKRIAVLGLAFKANTDDIRESRAVILINQLLSYGAEVIAYDPVAMGNMKKDYPTLNYAESVEDAAKNANAIVIMTDWNEFRGLDLSGIGELMSDKIILDAKNLLSREELASNGFIFEGVGRPYEY